MDNAIKVAVVGLDTSHSMEFIRRMQAPDCPADQKVQGLKAISCMRFETPFQDCAGLDARQRELEGWGVKVSESFEETVEGADAIMVEINDPAFHVEYFTKCAELGKPIFLDKPLAATLAEGKQIARLAAQKNTRVFSASSLRFSDNLIRASAQIPTPKSAMVYGPLGIAPAGSSICWYGVHSFEMLVRCMGTGAVKLSSVETGAGLVCVVDYPGERTGVVELSKDAWLYGGVLRDSQKAQCFKVEVGNIYTEQLREIAAFFKGGAVPVSMQETLEVTALLEAAEVSMNTGKSVTVDTQI